MKIDDIEINPELFKVLEKSEYFNLNLKEDLMNSDEIDFKKLHLLYHTSQKPFSPSVHTIRKRTSSRDTLEFFHKYVNKLSEKKFGVEIRNLFFCYPIRQVHDHTTNIVIPIDAYEMYFNENVNDLTWQYELSDTGRSFEEIWRDFKYKFMEITDNENVFDINLYGMKFNYSLIGNILYHVMFYEPFEKIFRRVWKILSSRANENLNELMKHKDEFKNILKECYNYAFQNIKKELKHYVDSVEKTKVLKDALRNPDRVPEIMLDCEQALILTFRNDIAIKFLTAFQKYIKGQL